MYRNVLIISLCILITVAAGGCVMEFDGAAGMVSGIVKEYKEVVELDSDQLEGESVKADLEMKVAKVTVDRSADKLLDAKFQYNAEVLKPEVEAKRDKLQILNRNARIDRNKPVNRWDVRLSDQVPFEMNMSAEASDVNMILGGMKIQEVDAALKASSMRLDFDRPNQIEMEKLKLDLKAGSADLYAMGNSRFRRLDIDSDASRLFLDLSGQNDLDGEVRIEAKASTVKLKLPEDAGISIIIDRFDISTVRLENSQILSRNEREYVSKNYESAKTKLKIIIDMKMTTLTVE